MVDPQKITLSEVKAGYGLNGQEADTLLNALFPDGVFPYETWRQAFAKWGWDRFLAGGSAEPLNLAYTADDICPTRIYAIQLTAYFIDPARLNKVSALEQGFDLVIQATYHDGSFPFQNEKETLFRLMRQESKEYHRQKSSEKIWRIHHQFTSEYNFIHEMFPDTIVVDKAAAIRHLAACGFPLRQEVKGITRSLVDSVLKAAAQEAPLVSEVAPAQKEPAADIQPQEQLVPIPVPTALWTGKTPEAILAAMRLEKYDDAIIAHVLYVKRRFRNKTDIGKLLDPSEREPSTYRKKTDRLLAEASGMNIVDV